MTSKPTFQPILLPTTSVRSGVSFMFGFLVTFDVTKSVTGTTSVDAVAAIEEEALSAFNVSIGDLFTTGKYDF